MLSVLNNIHHPSRSGVKYLPGLLALFILYPATVVAQVDQAGECVNVVSFAENLFFNAEFGEATEVLKECLPAKSLIDAERAEIHLLLAKIYFAEQKEAPAAEALGHLFSFKPDYIPEPFLPPPFVEFVEQIREIYNAEEVLDKQLMLLPPVSEEKKVNNKRWLLIGGSGLFAVTVAAIMSGGRSSTANTFPPPPGTPSGQ